MECICVDTAERMTLARVLVLGIFAFGFKKKDLFLKIEYHDDIGGVASVVFGQGTGTDVQTLSSQLLADRHKFILASGSPASELSDKKKPDNNPVALIEQLANLRDKGILTEEEFQKKKAVLIAKI